MQLCLLRVYGSSIILCVQVSRTILSSTSASANSAVWNPATNAIRIETVDVYLGTRAENLRLIIISDDQHGAYFLTTISLRADDFLPE